MDIHRLPEDFCEFVNKNLAYDPNVLRLKYAKRREEWVILAINHIESCQKAARKFIWGKEDLTPRFMPLPLSVEQATSAPVALLHARLLPERVRTVLDMTAGLGIDATALLRRQETTSLIGIEKNPLAAKALKINFANDERCKIIEGDSGEWLKDYEGCPFDLVMLDPARRGDKGQRVYNIHDCQPDVTQLLPLLSQKAKRAMVKLSPMLDVTQTLVDLPYTSEIHIIQEGGECRELLSVLDFEKGQLPVGEIPIVLHSSPDSEALVFTLEDEKNSVAEFSIPRKGHWLMEPSPGGMKAGAFNFFSAKFGIKAVAPMSHLYCGSSPLGDFPGACRKIVGVYPLNSHGMKEVAGATQGSADIAVRNAGKGLTPDTLRRKMRLKEGGKHRIIATTGADGTRLLILLEK